MLHTVLEASDYRYEGSVILHNVLFVPELHANLISCCKLCDNGYVINMGGNRCNGMLDGVMQFQGLKCQGAYRIITHPISPWSISANAAVSNRTSDQDDDKDEGSDTTRTNPLHLWNKRLGHANVGSIRKLSRSGAVSGWSVGLRNSIKDPCESCMKGKQTKRKLRTSKSRAQQRCAVIHTDVCGPMSVASFSCARFFVSFVYEYSGYVVIVPIVHKSDVLLQFKNFHAWIERKYECSVKWIHSDHSGEFVALKNYVSEKGIEHTMSPPYSPNSNGIAERANRTIVECARTILEHASLPKILWAEAVVHAARIRNLFFVTPLRHMN